MTKRHYTSDNHHDHEMVAVLRMLQRQAADGRTLSKEDLSRDQIDEMIAEHSRIQAENWDRVVGPDDTVFVLGDISMNPKKGAFQWFRERPGKKVLIAGNHDAVAGFHSKAINEQQKAEWADTFIAIRDFAFLKIGGRRVALSHYPYDGEGDRDIEDRMTEVRLRDAGIPLLHGHEHSTHRAHTSLAGTPMLHVGLDAWDMNLVSEATVLEWLEYLPR